MQSRKRIFRCLVVAVVFIFCMTVQVFAATTFTVDGCSMEYTTVETKTPVDSTKDTSGKNGETTCSWDNDRTFTLTARNSIYYYTGSWIFKSYYYAQSYSIKLTITNTSMSALTIEYTTDGIDDMEDATYEKTLASGDALAFTVSSVASTADTVESNLITGSVTIESVSEKSSVNVSFASSSRGSYTYTIGSGEEARVAAGAKTSDAMSLTAGSTVTLSHTEGTDGYTFYGWMGSGKLLGTSDDTYSVNEDMVIYPVYLADDIIEAGAPFTVGKNTYMFWHLAFADAKVSGNKVILSQNYSLPQKMEDSGLCKGHLYADYVSGADDAMKYIIPGGLTLLVPYSDTDTGLVEPVKSSNIDECTYRGGGTACTSAHKTLTVPQNTELVDNGTLIINGQVSGNSGKNEGTVFGTYGKMIVVGDVTINGTLYARGYIVDSNHTSHTDNNGTGLITVTAGGKVYMPLQILDYRGGNSSSSVYQWIFPILQYKFQNIMVRAKYEYGSELYGQYFTSVNDNNWSLSAALGAQMTIGSQQLFGSSTDCFIQLTEGSIYTDYDYSSDQLIISVDGTITFNDLAVKVTTSVKTLDITTKDKEIPLPYGVAIKVLDDAVVNLDKKIKMLPGSWVEIKDGGTINLSGSLHLYDATTYKNTWSYGMEAGQLNVTGLINKNAGTWNNDAVIYVGGTLNISGTIVESPAHSGGIVAYDGGQIKSTSEFVTSTTTYEMADASTDKVESTWSAVTGLLAGISTSATDYQPFSTSGTGDYIAKNLLNDEYNAAWYQHTVSVQDGTPGVTANGTSVNFDKEYDGTDNVVFYSVNNGTFYFKLGDDICTVSTADSKALAPTDGIYTLSGITADTTLVLQGHTEETDAAEEATCTETGLTEGSHCSVCNKVFTEQETTPALGHSFTQYLPNSAGTYTATCDNGCGTKDTLTSPDVPVQLAAIQLSAESEVLLKLKVKILDTLLAQDDAYILLTEEENEVTKQDQVTKITMKDLKAQGPDSSGRYVLSQGIAAGEMTGKVSIKGFDEAGNSIYIGDYTDNSIATELVRTVIDYTRLALTNGSDNMKALSAAMVTFGGYAQAYFGVDTTHPAYDVLAEKAFEDLKFADKYNNFDIEKITEDTITQVLQVTTNGSASSDTSTYATRSVGTAVETASSEAAEGEPDAEEVIPVETNAGETIPDETTVEETSPSETSAEETLSYVTVPSETTASVSTVSESTPEETTVSETASSEISGEESVEKASETIASETAESDSPADETVILTEVTAASEPAANISVMSDTTEEDTDTSEQDFGITYQSQKINLDSRVSMTTYFTLDSGNVDDYIFTLTYTQGGVDGLEMELLPEQEQDGSRWFIKIEDIPVAYWDYMYKITVTKAGSDQTYEIESSVLAWAKRCIANSANDAQVNMAKAMYYYNQAANDYFGK